MSARVTDVVGGGSGCHFRSEFFWNQPVRVEVDFLYSPNIELVALSEKQLFMLSGTHQLKQIGLSQETKNRNDLFECQ